MLLPPIKISLNKQSEISTPGFDRHKKDGAMNALVRVSAIISNAPYLLNVDCNHYINNSKALHTKIGMLFSLTSI
ncbi:hypothetical protein Vadar_012323 [Vaccinium darrowii]|uniref:Uncharacterized protein n=1 Tax=Vaccinium darrowii TaxID=229202 RepID=A0ACB7YD69_9ERIC|nr:hypothetical protein Vadar_012323 [Vaccinium darrowii]